MVLRGILLAATVVGALFVAVILAGPAAAWDARIEACLQPMLVGSLFVGFVGASLTLGTHFKRS